MANAIVSSRTRSGGYLARRSVNTRIAKTLAYVLLTVGGLAMALPFLWLISSSLKGEFEIFVFPPKWIPDPIRWSNYSEVVTTLPFGQYARNTIIITLFAMIGSVASSTVCAYSFARLRWPGRDVIFAILLATMMLPSAVRLIPLYIFYKELHWIDTFRPLIIPAYFGGGPFLIFLLRQFFLTIPVDMEEAAKIDGASPITILWNIMVPLARPAIVVVTIFEFQYNWNDFMGPLIYLPSEANRTLALGLVVMASGLQWGRDLTHLMMAVSVMMIAPVIVTFFVVQRVFVQGIALTGIKG